MDADFDAAMAAELEGGAKPQYATAQEQMEAELEAAMAADLAAGAEQSDEVGQHGNQGWQQLQLDAEKAADDVFSCKLSWLAHLCKCCTHSHNCNHVSDGNKLAAMAKLTKVAQLPPIPFMRMLLL